MRYRHQFLLELYQDRVCHPDNRIWLFRHEPVVQEQHYEKIYLYCREPKKALRAVTFQISSANAQLETTITEFHKLKHQYQPSLKGCLLEIPEELSQEEYQIRILCYTLEDEEHTYLEDTVAVTLSEEQKNKALSAMLVDENITMFPSMSVDYSICACGHLNKPGETCPNCHRTNSDIAAMIEKGSSAYCKQSFIKRYVNEKQVQYCLDHKLSYGTYLQDKAKDLPIQLQESDYSEVENNVKKKHKHCLIGSASVISILVILLIVNVALGIAKQNDDSDYLDYGSFGSYNSNNDNSDDYDNYDDGYGSFGEYDDETKGYQLKICNGDFDGYSMELTLESYDNSIETLSVSVSMTSEDVGTEISQLDDSMLSLFKASILEQLGISESDTGITVETSIFSDILYCDIVIDMQEVKPSTLSTLGLSALVYYDYDQAIKELETTSGMYCY